MRYHVRRWGSGYAVYCGTGRVDTREPMSKAAARRYAVRLQAAYEKRLAVCHCSNAREGR